MECPADDLRLVWDVRAGRRRFAHKETTPCRAPGAAGLAGAVGFP